MTAKYSGPERRTTCEIDCDYKNLLVEKIIPQLQDVHDFVTGVRAVFGFVKYGLYVIGAIVAIGAAAYEVTK